MTYEPLHHKYRPQTFSDLVGQETIALTLSNALEQAKIAPAYLFTGPRGTGKTSSARILAKSLNCLASSQPTPHPCGKCETCLAIAKGSALDVMEIDAASNTGVDNIREIIERSRFAPVQCRYKIYAIDECHMLSTAAFNALLKTLEEPPSRVVFILATTDPQRVLSTIISRCQRFDYRRIPLVEMINHLKYIADRESIKIADDALTLVAQISNGGLRDAESLLDQLSLLPETISVEKVWDLVGAVPEQDLLKLLQAINANDSLAVLQQCRSLLDRGREPLVVLQNLATFYLNLLIAKTAPQHAELTAVTETCWQKLCAEAKNWQTTLILRGQQHLKEAETQLKRTTQPRLWLEVTLLGLLPEAYNTIASHPQTVVPTSPQQVVTPLPTIVVTPPATQNTQTAPATPTSANSAPPVTPTPQPSVPTAVQSPPAQAHNLDERQTATQAPDSPAPEPVAPSAGQDSADNRQIWERVVNSLQPPTTQALLKQQCHLVSFDGNSAIVSVSSPKLEKMAQQKIPNIEAAFARVCQHKVRVQIEVGGSKKNNNNVSAGDFVREVQQPPWSKPATVPQQSPSPPPVKTSTPAVQPTKIEDRTHTPARQSPIESLKPFTRQENANLAQKVAGHKTSVVNSPLVENDLPVDNNVAIPDFTNKLESALDEDYADTELQQAIASLTQSFEGEVVQLDNDLDDFNDEDEAEISLEASSNIEPLSRPDIEDYDDDW